MTSGYPLPLIPMTCGSDVALESMEYVFPPFISAAVMFWMKYSMLMLMTMTVTVARGDIVLDERFRMRWGS